MKKFNIVVLILFSMMLLVSGCASVPMASESADQRAKQFKPVSGKANIYIYRNEQLGAALHKTIEINGTVIADTAADTYIFLEVKPGRYNIMSDGNKEKGDIISIIAKAGKNYYVWQEMKFGMIHGTKLSLVDRNTGRTGVLECKLIK